MEDEVSNRMEALLIATVTPLGHKMELMDRHYGVLEGLTTERIKEKYNVDMKSLSREIDDLGEIEPVSSVIRKEIKVLIDKRRIFNVESRKTREELQHRF